MVVIEVASNGGEMVMLGGLFNGGRMVMLQRSWRENGHVTEVVSLMEGEWLLQRKPV